MLFVQQGIIKQCSTRKKMNYLQEMLLKMK